MGDATVGALASVPAPAHPDVATATSVDLIFTATERDRIAYVAFVASVNPTEEAQEGRLDSLCIGCSGRSAATLGIYSRDYELGWEPYFFSKDTRPGRRPCLSLRGSRSRGYAVGDDGVG
jgi:hypothetical protein